MSINGKAFIVGAFEHPDRVIPDRSVAQIHAENTAGRAGRRGAEAVGHRRLLLHRWRGHGPGGHGRLPRSAEPDVSGWDDGRRIVAGVSDRACRAAIAMGKCNVALVTLANRPRSEAEPRGMTPSPEVVVRAGLRQQHAGHVRAGRAAAHVRVRHDQRAAGVGQSGGVGARAVQHARAVAEAGDRRGRAELADAERSAASAGLLRGDRRRWGGHRRSARRWRARSIDRRSRSWATAKRPSTPTTDIST